MKTRTSRAGFSKPVDSQSAGFTLFEILIVMVVITIVIGAVSALYRSPSDGVRVKTAALLAASRLRELRSAAMLTGSVRVATIDAAERVIRFSDKRAPLELGRAIDITVTAAEIENRSPTTAGIRFFPNGSSSGATIALRSERQAYEVRVNWLTGRVSTSALH